MYPKIVQEPQYDFSDVLIQPQRSRIVSRSHVMLENSYRFKNGATWVGIPIVAANMDTTGTFDVNKILTKNNMLTAMNKFYTAEDYSAQTFTNHEKNSIMVSTGISDTDFDTLKSILAVTECKFICIDVANGYMDSLLHFCTKVRKMYPSKIIIAGNVATKERVQELILYGGVDIVKVGIGTGSACTTRVKTGVGIPQLSAILECASAAHEAGGYIMADGGITCPGDLGKAFGGGADFVMVGGQFAGHDENPGTIIEENGVKFKEFYGMSSTHAMNKHYREMKKYRSSEGRYLKIPYRGSLQDTVDDFLGGLRSTCSYVGASSITKLAENTRFRIVGRQVNTSFL